jgi:hypothetical protein
MELHPVVKILAFNGEEHSKLANADVGTNLTLNPSIGVLDMKPFDRSSHAPGFGSVSMLFVAEVKFVTAKRSTSKLTGYRGHHPTRASFPPPNRE